VPCPRASRLRIKDHPDGAALTEVARLPSSRRPVDAGQDTASGPNFDTGRAETSCPDALFRAHTSIGTMCENGSDVQEDDKAVRYWYQTVVNTPGASFPTAARSWTS